MKKTHIKYAVFLLVVIGLYNFLFASMDVHYKLTINVETPEGVKSGSAVREIKMSRFRYNIGGTRESTTPIHLRGEAVIVDLDERGVLFGLIDSGSYQELFKAFPYNAPSHTFGPINHYNSLPVGSKADLSLRWWPQMVSFTDMDDPKTVQSVLDVEWCDAPMVRQGICDEDELAIIANSYSEDLFGEGVNIQSVTVEITDEDVTEGSVDKFLPKGFWDNYRVWNKSMSLRERSNVYNPGQTQFERSE